MHAQDDISLSEVHRTVDPQSKKGWKKFFAFIGPAYLVSIGYMDPGNWATDIAGGSRFGYSLIWVLLMSNLMAMVLQSFAARLGIVRGRDLAQANREVYPRPVNFILYILAELAIAATDLAEVLGMAIGIQLLTGLPLFWGISLTVLDTFLILQLQKLGMRKMEAFILALIAVIFIAFLAQIVMAKPDAGQLVKGFIPKLESPEALYIAISIIGATVMPHNLYLHSALVQSRKIGNSDNDIKQALRFNNIDTVLALNVAFLVNAGILILAASVFHSSGNSHIASIKDAHRMLPDFLGSLAPVLFAIALIAAGQSSTVTGTLAGQIIMEGYLHLRLNPWLRRLITRLIAVVPSAAVIYFFGEDKVDEMLILSQVILSLQLAFAVIPLIHFVSDKKSMGRFSIGKPAKIVAWLIAIILVSLNLKMIIDVIKTEWPSLSPGIKLIGSVIALGFITLILYVTVYPLLSGKTRQGRIHADAVKQINIAQTSYKKIAIALDFSGNEEKVISAALSQGKADAHYVLIHIVESAGAKIKGEDLLDLETRQDQLQLNGLVNTLKENGYSAEGILGYRNRAKEIAKLANEANADLLVMGAHGHSGLSDYVYGSTINRVRHYLKIPVLIIAS